MATNPKDDDYFVPPEILYELLLASKAGLENESADNKKAVDLATDRVSVGQRLSKILPLRDGVDHHNLWDFFAGATGLTKLEDDTPEYDEKRVVAEFQAEVLHNPNAQALLNHHIAPTGYQFDFSQVTDNNLIQITEMPDELNRD